MESKLNFIYLMKNGYNKLDEYLDMDKYWSKTNV